MKTEKEIRELYEAVDLCCWRISKALEGETIRDLQKLREALKWVLEDSEEKENEMRNL